MKTLNKKSYVVLLLLIIVIMLAASAMFVSDSAKASETTTPPAIVMEKGASARVGVDEVNGLRFIASMSNEDYGWFAKNVGESKTYASVKFGMLIAPADYLVEGKEFTKENLFGEKAIYAWANYQNGEWVYDTEANEGKVRIINIVADKMQTYIDNDENEKMAVTGAIKDYKEHNIVRDFVGCGYYQLFDGQGNVVKTELASYAENSVDNNTRSMIEVVETAMAENVLDKDQLDSAKQTYIDTIKDDLRVKNYAVEVMSDKTVAGNEYNGSDTQADVSTVIYIPNGTEFRLNSWKSSSAAIEVVDGIVTGKACGLGYWITSELFPDLAIAGEVYTPISSRADLDALGFDYREDKNADKWAYGMRYRLTKDIDYATDTSTYGNFRMNDGNGAQDVWDRYLIPIAASIDGAGMLGAAFENGMLEWGVFGELGRDGLRFGAVLDGAGHAIKNAVIPYGIVFCYAQGMNSIINNNFIGSIYNGGQLKNIAFTDLIFENPSHLANNSLNPYYADSNPNNNGKKLKDNGYITGDSIRNYNYGSAGALDPSNRAGLVGMVGNAVIENVYVEAVVSNGTYGNGENGVVVAKVEADMEEGGIIPVSVKNCITVVGQTLSNVGYSEAGWSYNSGFGAVIGRSLASAESIQNCFAIADYQVYDVTGGVQTISTIFCHNTTNVPLAQAQSTNCGVYADVNVLQAEQADVLANMSIAQYLN